MRARRKQAERSTELRPALQAFVDVFIAEIGTGDPVEAARLVADKSRNWADGAKRRRANACRIALLRMDALEGVVQDQVGDNAPALDETDPEVPAEVAVAEPVDIPAPPPRAPIIPKLNMQATAGMFAELDAMSESENSTEREKEDGQSWQADKTPEAGADRWKSASLEFPDSDPSSYQGYGTGPEDSSWFERNDRLADDEAGPVAKKHTMTDLSLSILTGSFKTPSEQDIDQKASSGEGIEDRAPDAPELSIEEAQMQNTGTLMPPESAGFQPLNTGDFPDAQAPEEQTPAKEPEAAKKRKGKRRVDSEMSTASGPLDDEEDDSALADTQTT